VAASYLDNPLGFPNPDEPLPTVQSAKVKMIYLTMVRDVSEDQIRSAFEESLDVNGIDLNDPSVRALLDSLSFDLPIGTTAAVVGYHSLKRPEYVYGEVFDKKFLHSGEDLSFKLWRVWFGVPVDDGMRKLKASLVGQALSLESDDRAKMD